MTCTRGLSPQEAVWSPGPQGTWGAGAQAYKHEAVLPLATPGKEQILNKCFYVIRAVCFWPIPFTSLGLSFLLGKKELCSFTVLLTIHSPDTILGSEDTSQDR